MAERHAYDPFQELRIGFTAAVSHELRTPLARLLALLDSASLPATDTEALLEQARAEVLHMTELVDDVLFLSELETGRQVVSLGRTAVKPVVDEVVSQSTPSAERANVKLLTIVPRDIEVPLRRRMLRVVIENLVANAIRHAGDGAHCTISATIDDGRVVLSVSDDGTGVPEVELPRLFERFYRGDRSRATRGTGLGLAIVKHVVTAAGGSVEALDGGGLEIRCTFR
jgi:two-component system, OmpR family, phosphate regulon sensor histidine kinase PhoR